MLAPLAATSHVRMCRQSNIRMLLRLQHSRMRSLGVRPGNSVRTGVAVPDVFNVLVASWYMYDAHKMSCRPLKEAALSQPCPVPHGFAEGRQSSNDNRSKGAAHQVSTAARPSKTSCPTPPFSTTIFIILATRPLRTPPLGGRHTVCP